jgi:hypothetical protein
MERGRGVGVRSRSTGWRSFVVGRGGVIVDRLERIDIGNWGRSGRWQATPGFFFLRTPNDVNLTLNDDPI